jgi:uncharacterized membrane protein YbhN (UPF0104 family)
MTGTTPPSGRRRLVRPLLTGALMIAAAAFLTSAVARDWAKLRAFDWQVRPLALAASLVLHVGVFVFGVHIWARVLRCFDQRPPSFRWLLRTWAVSNGTRYIPGMVWQLVSVAGLARGAGIPAAELLASLAVQMGIVLLAAGLVGAAAAPWLAPAFATPWLALVVPLSLACVHPALINVGLTLLNRLTRGRQALRWHGSWLDGGVLLVLQVVSWGVYGFAFSVFVRAVVQLPGAETLPLVGMHALAFAAGYLVVFAPAGLGAREAALTLLLSRFAPTSVAVLISVLARLWTVAAEVTTLALALLLARRNRTEVVAGTPQSPG